jgi:hypothetical protein
MVKATPGSALAEFPQISLCRVISNESESSLHVDAEKETAPRVAAREAEAKAKFNV